MIFDGKLDSEITPDDIRNLVLRGEREGRFLDLKRDPYGRSDKARHETIKDICAFANAAGGYIVIGVDEDGSRGASAIVGVDDPENVRRSLLDRCLTLIAPRLTQLNIGIITVDNKRVVVCNVPESDQKPHAATPDREHHYFWMRYQDGVKLMTVAEIREAMEGDAVRREIAHLRREVVAHREQDLLRRELQEDVTEQGLLQLRSDESFAPHAERAFKREVGKRPFFRLTATPLPVHGRNISEHREALRALLKNPPDERRNGFGVGLHDLQVQTRERASGLFHSDIDAHHLRLYWNGHLEFWNAADDEWICWSEAPNLPIEQRPFHALSLIESTACFVRLSRRICQEVGFAGDVRFRFELYQVRNRRLLPHAPGKVDYMFHQATARRVAESETGVITDTDLKVLPITASADDLTGTVAFKLISQVYCRLGFERKHIPYFTDQDEFIYAGEPE